MRTVRLLIEYDGTAFSGWQAQAGEPLESSEHGQQPTVQGALQRALQSMTGEQLRVRAASRTDAGVHARGQVVAFTTANTRIPVLGFARGLCSLLPEAVVVREAAEVELGWEPRHHARGKRYRYSYWADPQPTALDRHRAWHVREPMDLARMAQGALHLLGTHDFEAFRSAGCDAPHAVRTMFEVRPYRGERSLVQLEVVGNAFCRNMVRIFAGCLKEVAVGRWAPEEVQRVLLAKDRTLGGATAPAHGLCLEEVIYDERLPPRPEKGHRP